MRYRYRLSLIGAVLWSVSLIPSGYVDDRPRSAQAQGAPGREPSPGSSQDAGVSTPLNPTAGAHMDSYDYDRRNRVIVSTSYGESQFRMWVWRPDDSVWRELPVDTRPTELWAWGYR